MFNHLEFRQQIAPGASSKIPIMTTALVAEEIGRSASLTTSLQQMLLQLEFLHISNTRWTTRAPKLVNGPIDSI